MISHVNACHYGEIDPKCNGCVGLMSHMTPDELTEFNRVEEI